MGRTFDRLRFVLPVGVEEALVAELWTLPTLGLETRAGAADTVSIDAWFATGTVRTEVFAPWRARGVSIALETIEQQDDLAAYRAQTPPLDIGERFRVDPRDADVGAPAEGAPVGGAPARSEGSASENGRFLLRIPARVAFGTGSHETTRLVLTLLETLEVRACRVLDVGCGSGILSLAALRLGAREATGFDLDSPSALVADQNASLNPWSVRPRFYAGRFDALSAVAPFDLILVNVLPERIRADLPRLVRSLAPGGRVVSAGALVADRGDMLAAWARVGLSAQAERVAGEWIGFVLARGDGAA